MVFKLSNGTQPSMDYLQSRPSTKYFCRLFESTVAMASPAESDLIHISFYRFVPLTDPEAVAEVVRELAQALTGNVLIAHEGISAALAGQAQDILTFESALQTDARLNNAFTGIVFKHSACTTRPFWRMKVYVKPEIVALGLPDVVNASQTPTHIGHLSPQEWRDLIAQDDVVVLDNRNSFEYRLGRFKNAIDPCVDNFRDFPSYVQAHAAQWKAEGKRVAMYCTGGIRCEKTGHWMQSQGLEIYQLDGGIVSYFEKMPDAERDWEGELFVFDNRVAIDTQLQETPRTPDEVYDPHLPDEKWRLERAQRLDAFNPKRKVSGTQATPADQSEQP